MCLSQWEQAGYALWSCNAASFSLFHWSTIGENKPRNVQVHRWKQRERLRANNTSFFQKIVFISILWGGYFLFMFFFFFFFETSVIYNALWWQTVIFLIVLQNDLEVTPKSFISTNFYGFVFIYPSFSQTTVWTFVILNQFYSNAFPNTWQSTFLTTTA